MSNSETTTASESPKAAPKAAKSKKPKGKPAIPDKPPNKPQLRILAVLVKAGKTGQSGEKLTKLAKIASRGWLSEYIGTEGGQVVSGYGHVKLVPAGLVKAIKFEIGEATDKRPALVETRYVITAAGTKALKDAEKANGKAAK